MHNTGIKMKTWLLPEQRPEVRLSKLV